MNKRLDELLVKNHPLLFGDRHGDMRNTAMCWGFECGNGWYSLLKEASDKLEVLIHAEMEKNVSLEGSTYMKAVQVKEKFGTLRFYMNSGTDTMYKIIEKAEAKSAKTCEVCGKPGKLRGTGWLYTSCRKHKRD